LILSFVYASFGECAKNSIAKHLPEVKYMKLKQHRYSGLKMDGKKMYFTNQLLLQQKELASDQQPA